MPGEIEKTCPILHSSLYESMSKCIGKRCAWWCDFAGCCAVSLTAGILADSTINQNVFGAKEETEKELEERKG